MVSPSMLSLIWGYKKTTIAYSFARQLQLEVQDVNEVIWSKGMGGFRVL